MPYSKRPIHYWHSAHFPTKIEIFYVKFLISDYFLMCAQASSAFIRVLNMAATVLS